MSTDEKMKVFFGQVWRGEHNPSDAYWQDYDMYAPVVGIPPGRCKELTGDFVVRDGVLYVIEEVEGRAHVDESPDGMRPGGSYDTTWTEKTKLGQIIDGVVVFDDALLKAYREWLDAEAGT